MPITQDRLLKLIYAGTAWKYAYESAQAQITYLSVEINEGRLDPFIGTLNMNAVFHQHEPRASVTMPLELEEGKMSPSHQNFNNKERERQERRRRKRGVKPLPKHASISAFPAAAPPKFSLAVGELRAVTPEEEIKVRRSMDEALRALEVEQGIAPSKPPEKPSAPPKPEFRSIAEITPRAVTEEDLKDGLF